MTKIKGDSFVRANTIKATKPSIIMLVYAGQKAGKTYFGFNKTPEGIIYFNFDQGLKGVIEQFKKKDIIIAGVPQPKGREKENYPVYAFAKMVTKDERKKQAMLEYNAAQAVPVWDRFVDDWASALKSDARTLIIDTANAAYDLGKFAYVGMAGKLDTKDDPWGQKSGALGALFRTLIVDAYDSDKNVILLAREKEKWAGGAPSDEFVPEGWKGVPYEVQVTLRLTRRMNKNKTERRGMIVDSRFDGDEMNGQRFGGPDEPPLNFPSVASFVTGTDTADWEE